MRLAPLLLAALFFPAAAETGTVVKVTVHGTVVYNQIRQAPLDTVRSGHKVDVSFLLNSDDYVNGSNFPTRGYVIDLPSYQMAFKTTKVRLQSPFPVGEAAYFVLRNNDPAVDGFLVSRSAETALGLPIQLAGSFGNGTSDFLATYGGTKLASLDLLGALGTHDFTGMSVFGFRMEDGSRVPMEIDFEWMKIEVVATS